MATDWAADVKKYAAKADDAVIAGIVRYCGIALSKPDSALVAFSDAKELARVRTNFLKKKLARTEADDVLDAAIAKVGAKMKADKTRNRVTVYYLLAHHFKALDIFVPKAKSAAPAKSKAALAANAAPVKAKATPAKVVAAPAAKKAAAPAKKAPAAAKPAASAVKAAPAPKPVPAVAAAASAVPQPLVSAPVSAPPQSAPPAAAAPAAPSAQVDQGGIGAVWWLLGLAILAFMGWWLFGRG